MDIYRLLNHFDCLLSGAGARSFILKAIGTVMHTVGTRILVMRCDPAQLPRLYADVVSRRLKPVGKVVEVFGSVAAPYAAIHCRDDCRMAAGEKLFIST